MFKDINRVEIMGRVTQVPEVKYTNSGTAYVVLNVATNRNIKRGDEWTKEVTYHAITFWAKVAEKIGEKVLKGTKVWIEGRLFLNRYETKDGNKVSKLVIMGNDISLLEGYKKSEQTQQGQRSNTSAAAGSKVPLDEAMKGIFGDDIEDVPAEGKLENKLDDGGAF